jgi:hypothetical protein
MPACPNHAAGSHLGLFGRALDLFQLVIRQRHRDPIRPASVRVRAS